MGLQIVVLPREVDQDNVIAPRRAGNGLVVCLNGLAQFLRVIRAEIRQQGQVWYVGDYYTGVGRRGPQAAQERVEVCRVAAYRHARRDIVHSQPDRHKGRVRVNRDGQLQAQGVVDQNIWDAGVNQVNMVRAQQVQQIRWPVIVIRIVGADAERIRGTDSHVYNLRAAVRACRRTIRLLGLRRKELGAASSEEQEQGEQQGE